MTSTLKNLMLFLSNHLATTIKSFDITNDALLLNKFFAVSFVDSFLLF